MTDGSVEEFVAGDYYPWKYRRYEPLGKPRLEIVALHGIQSHGGWYIESCRALAQAGFAVSFLDRRGCGLNPNYRGDAPSFRRLVDDIAEFIRDLRPKAAGPVILMAISWGAKLAVALQKRHPGLAVGLVLITPGFRPRLRPPLRHRLMIAATRFIRPTKLFPIPLNEPELFTDNPERRRFIAEDSLALRQATARLLFESRRMDFYLKLARRQVRVPTLVMLAEHDRIIDNRKTRRFVRRFRSGDLTVIEYSGAHHTLEFETNGPPFFDDLLKWFEQRFG